MAGHNKWSKIRHRKAVVDKRRGKAWSMCSRAIISAARQGGPDPNFNILLRAALDEAKYHNVPKDNIDRAIKKGAGAGEGDSYESYRYEGYGPGGVAVIVEALTNNRTRTAGDVRNIFAENGGNLGSSGCVAHIFEHKGRITVLAPAADEDRLMEAVLTAGADDVRRADDDPPSFEVFTAPESFLTIKSALAKSGWKLGECVLDMIPTLTVSVTGDHAKPLLDLIDAMEDNEDVKKVYSNADIPESILAALGD